MLRLWQTVASFTTGLIGSRGISKKFAAQLLAEVDGLARPRGDPEALRVRELASLYSGLGSVFLLDERVVLKQIVFPKGRSFTEQRDERSYRVEAAFFRNYAPNLLAAPHVLALPKPLLIKTDAKGVTLAMSRLRGDPMRSGSAFEQAGAALEWLAGLHAAYWGASSEDLRDLQPVGSYWHLDDRQEELDAMPTHGWEGRLRLAALALDLRLKADAMQTCIHGDAKPANMFFERQSPRAPTASAFTPAAAREPLTAATAGHASAPSGRTPSRVIAQLFDFQYVGRAPPSRDIAYVLTCVTGAKAGPAEDALMAQYHTALSSRLRARGLATPALEALQQSTEIALVDLARWMSGWGWWAKEGLARRCVGLLDELDGGEELEDEDAYVRALFEKRPPDYGGACYDYST